MKRHRDYSGLRGARRCVAPALLGVALGVVATPVLGADPMPVKAPAGDAFSWQGFYVGGQVGYGRTTVHATVPEPTASPLSQGFGSAYGGVQVGYNQILTSGWLLGVELDVSLPGAAPTDNVVWANATPTSAISETID